MEIDKLPPSIEKYDHLDYKILFATRHIDDLYNKDYALWKWTGMEHPGTYNPNLQEAIFYLALLNPYCLSMASTRLTNYLTRDSSKNPTWISKMYAS